MDTMRIIAVNVRGLRRALGLDQGELASRADVSMQTVSNLETGRLKDIKVSTLEALARPLGVSVAELLAPASAHAA